MRRKTTFVLTIMPAETSKNELHGSLRSIADGSEATFSNFDELHELIQKTINVQLEKVELKQLQNKPKPAQAS